MAVVRGCNLPDDLYYHIDNNVWARLEADGTVTVGMTAYACALAGALVSSLPKKIGKEIEQNKAVSTVESGKWVGPVKAPVTGILIEVNEVVSTMPSIVNEDPYGQGWIAKMRPSQWATQKAELVTGEQIVPVFEAKMNADGFSGC